MKHTGLKARMVIAGSVLFGFYIVLASILYESFGSLPLVVGGSVLFVGVQYIIGKKIALWSVGAEDIPEDKQPKVHRMVEDLSDDMGLDKPRVMYAEMGTANAFAVGRKGNGTVVLSTELMNMLDDQELEGVIAHELAHINNRDVVMMVLGQSIAMMVGWFVYFVVQEFVEGIAGWLLGWLLSTVANLLVMLFVLVISRAREYAADRDAAEYTGNPESMASALTKISTQHETTESSDVDGAVGALCILNQDRGLLAALFATHPPIENRINRLQEMSRY